MRKKRTNSTLYPLAAPLNGQEGATIHRWKQARRVIREIFTLKQHVLTVEADAQQSMLRISKAANRFLARRHAKMAALMQALALFQQRRSVCLSGPVLPFAAQNVAQRQQPQGNNAPTRKVSR
jgi:hypothetical protein